MTDVTRRKMLGSIPAAAIGAAAGTTFLGSNILAAREAGQPQEGKSLYDRLGGYDAISARYEKPKHHWNTTCCPSRSILASLF